MNEHLFNEVTGIYTDYMGLQYRPILISKQTFENVEWRNDGKCGSSTTLNTLQT